MPPIPPFPDNLLGVIQHSRKVRGPQPTLLTVHR